MRWHACSVRFSPHQLLVPRLRLPRRCLPQPHSLPFRQDIQPSPGPVPVLCSLCARPCGPARQLNAWIISQRAHAVANGLPVISVNRVGHEPDPSGQTNGIQFWGNSFVAGPQGEFLAQASNDHPENMVVEIDMERSENVRRWWPFLRDRRIDEYDGLTKRFLD